MEAAVNRKQRDARDRKRRIVHLSTMGLRTLPRLPKTLRFKVCIARWAARGAIVEALYRVARQDGVVLDDNLHRDFLRGLGRE